MADVTGPISTLPGARHAVPEGMKCDSHPDRDAVARVQGETDSMGSEMIDMCSECFDNERQSPKVDRAGICDWCREHSAALKDTRDFEEGLCGRVYQVCTPCRQAARDAAYAELAEQDDF